MARREHRTGSKYVFLNWFPELDICPACRKGRTVFMNFDVKKITIEVQGDEGTAPTLFSYEEGIK